MSDEGRLNLDTLGQEEDGQENGSEGNEENEDVENVNSTEEEQNEEEESETQNEEEEEQEAEESEEEASEEESEEDSGSEEESESESESEEEESQEEFNIEEQVFDVEGEEKTFKEFYDEYSELKERQKQIDSDDFLKRFVDHYTKTGDAKAFLDSQAVDYEKLDAMDIIRKDFDQRHEGLSEKGKEKLFKSELLKKYNLDLTGEETVEESDAELGQELLELDAKKLRNKYIEEQKNFAIPDAPEKQESNDDVTQPDIEELKEIVQNNDSIKKISSKGTLEIETQNGKVNLKVEDVDKLVGMTVDADKEFFTLFDDGKGGLDYSKWLETASFAQNPEAFKAELVAHGRTIERESYLKETKNTDGEMSDKNRRDAKAESGDDFISALKKQHAEKLR